mmetsp:Transcript_6080/g.11115  ORF Transcript_6080/g.11115 Transcript_6080/m.11115 type:complete len:346 (+) Transcript_6080:50-1087(+)
MRETWIDASAFLDGRLSLTAYFAQDGRSRCHADDAVEPTEIPSMFSKTCIGFGPMANLDRFLPDTPWNNHPPKMLKACRQTWHGAWRCPTWRPEATLREEERRRCSEAAGPEARTMRLTTEEDSQAQRLSVGEVEEASVESPALFVPTKIEETTAKAPEMEPSEPEELAEVAQVLCSTEARGKELLGPSCAIVAYRSGASQLTASWVMAPGHEARREGYKSALDLLREQEAPFARGHVRKKKGRSSSASTSQPPPLVIEHHHVHRHRHRHHREVFQTEEEARRAAGQVQTAQPKEATMRLPPLAPKQNRAAPVGRKGRLHAALSLPVLRHRGPRTQMSYDRIPQY